ncbi:efflux RND transporter permease subunit [Aquisphaera insulae]|uniref:efflux RND transporter permease subunit n=1 Tax=Aquisphaera insulae TaxID=2712864 RepID=UPI0013E9DDA9|nr:CusA/CzcA family heavy metal efflux RND transporter [Aquisphaera insulae]
MVHAIISWSLSNRLIVILGVLALVGMGVHSARNLNVEAYPDPTPPLVEIIAQNPGAGPEEMERLVAVPLETALNGMPGLEDLRSTSIAGLTDIKCQFAYGTNPWSARQEVINRISDVDLPAGVRPRLSPWSPTGEIVRYVLEGPGYTTNQLKSVQDWVLNRELRRVPGVIDVTGFGGTVKQYQVLIDPRLLHQYNVTLADVEDAINRSNANVGGDILTMGGQSHNVRALGLLGEGVDPLDPSNIDQSYRIEADKLEDIQNVVITSRGGEPIYVRQVAKVEIGHRPRLGKAGRILKEKDGVTGWLDEDDVVEGIVLMRKYEKSLVVANAVGDKLKEIERRHLLPRGMSLRVFNQRADLVEVTTHNVLHNLVVGMVLVGTVLFVFLGDLTSAVIVALVIPLALLFSISVLFVQGESANLLSIGAVDFGIIVDSSVIIVENIYRHITAHDADRSRPLISRIAEASHEIERALFFSTMIIVCAFLPLFAMTGPEGALFGPMAKTYAFAICGALTIAVTLAPVLCSFFFKNKSEEKDTIVDRALKAVYVRSLVFVLRHRVTSLLVIGLLLAVTAAMIPTLGGEFMPQLEEGNLWIRAVLPRTVSLESAARLAPRLRETIASIPEIRAVMSQIGRPDDGTDVTSFFNLEFNAPLRPMEEWRPGVTREKIQDELAEKFKAYPGVDFNFSQLIRDNVEEALSGVKGANSIKLFGSDLKRLEDYAQKVMGALRGVHGIENVGMFHIIGQPNLIIRIDRRACARYGVNVADVESVVQVAVGGRAFSQMVEGEKLFDIVLRLPLEMRDDPEVISRLHIEIAPAADGQRPGRIPLSQLATINAHEPGASYIYRENNQRYIPIKFSVRGVDLATAIGEAQRRVNDPTTGVRLPEDEGYRLEWSGEFAQMEEANQRLLWIVPISIGLIMLLLYTAFKSIKDAFLVILNVLTATMGGVWSLKLTGMPFSISAAVGFVSIFGVAVQNGVLLISYFNQMRTVGLPVREAVIRGAELRLRPVVMTSLTAVLGLLPAAMANSIGSQAQKPLAVVVVGGMLVNMLLTQFLMPVLYTYFPGRRGVAGDPAELVEGSQIDDRLLADSNGNGNEDHRS